MGQFKELMIQAVDALDLLEKHVATLPIGRVTGSVDEVKFIKEENAFLVLYSANENDDTIAYHFLIHEADVHQIESGAYNLASHGAFELTDRVPEILHELNARRGEA